MTNRPERLRPPAPLSKSPPVPQPQPGDVPEESLSPTRYGDWEHKGVAVDF